MTPLEEFKRDITELLRDSADRPNYIVDATGELIVTPDTPVVNTKFEETDNLTRKMLTLFGRFYLQEIRKYPTVAAFTVSILTIDSSINQHEVISFAGGNKESVNIILETIKNPLDQ